MRWLSFTLSRVLQLHPAKAMMWAYLFIYWAIPAVLIGGFVLLVAL